MKFNSTSNKFNTSVKFLFHFYKLGKYNMVVVCYYIKITHQLMIRCMDLFDRNRPYFIIL